MDVYLNVGCIYVLLCVILFHVSNGEVYYAGSQRSSFYDANATCHDLGGHVLRYGMVFVDALVQCHQYIYAWTGLPYYKKLHGCYKGNATLKTPPDQRQEDKRVAICADFCSSETFTHFGVMTTECHCYNQDDFSNLELSNSCQIPLCPGNLFDICGMSPKAIVYKKVTEVEDFGSCYARTVYGDGKSHNFIGYCYDEAPFLCKVGDSNEVSCSLHESTTQSEYKSTEAENFQNTLIPTTVKMTARVTLEESFSSTLAGETEKPTATPQDTVHSEANTLSTRPSSTSGSENKTKSGKVLSQVESVPTDNKGMIVAIAVSGGLFVIIIVIVVVLVKCSLSRKKKALNEKDDNHVTTPPSVYFTNSATTDDKENDVSYNSVQLNSIEPEKDATGYTKVTKAAKPRSQMCDQEFLIYDPVVFTGN